MSVSTKLAAVVVGGLLFATTYAPASAQSVDAKAPASQSVSGAPSVLGVIAPLLNNTTQHVAQKHCKADSLYSAHDVVGDSESCFISKVDARTNAPGVGFGIF